MRSITIQVKPYKTKATVRAGVSMVALRAYHNGTLLPMDGYCATAPASEADRVAALMVQDIIQRHPELAA